MQELKTNDDTDAQRQTCCRQSRVKAATSKDHLASVSDENKYPVCFLKFKMPRVFLYIFRTTCLAFEELQGLGGLGMVVDSVMGCLVCYIIDWF